LAVGTAANYLVRRATKDGDLATGLNVDVDQVGNGQPQRLLGMADNDVPPLRRPRQLDDERWRLVQALVKILGRTPGMIPQSNHTPTTAR
jgi:hypothetical protein